MKGSATLRLGLAVAGVLLAGSALAQGPGGGMGGPGFGGHRPPMERAFGSQGRGGNWWNNQKVVDELKLTDDQRKAMDGILMEHREKLVDLHANLEKAELAMEPLMKDDQPNETRILASIDKIAQARAELEKANARFLLALRGKLTPDQWKTLQADRAKRMQQGRGGWGADGRGRDGRGDGPRPDAQGRDGWNRNGQGGPGQGGQYRRQGPPPPEPQAPAQGAPPAPTSQVDQGDGSAAPAAE